MLIISSESDQYQTTSLLFRRKEWKIKITIEIYIWKYANLMNTLFSK